MTPCRRVNPQYGNDVIYITEPFCEFVEDFGCDYIWDGPVIWVGVLPARR